jgi:hypothetical protein
VGVAGVPVGDHGEACSGEVCGAEAECESSVPRSRFDQPPDSDERRRECVTGGAEVVRTAKTSTLGVGTALVDVVPAWAMVKRDGPIPDVAPPPMTTPGATKWRVRRRR